NWLFQAKINLGIAFPINFLSWSVLVISVTSNTAPSAPLNIQLPASVNPACSHPKNLPIGSPGNSLTALPGVPGEGKPFRSQNVWLPQRLTSSLLYEEPIKVVVYWKLELLTAFQVTSASHPLFLNILTFIVVLS